MTKCCLVDLIAVTLAVGDDNSKLADIGIEGSVKDRFDNLATTGQVEIFGQG